MSFLLFTARKLQLKREINANSYEQIVVSNQLQAAQKRVSQFQEYMSNMKNMTSVFAQGLQAAAVQKGYEGLGIEIDYNRYNKAGNEAYTQEINEKLNDNNIRSSVSTIQNGAATLAQTFSAVTDSIFTSVNNVQLAVLQAESSRLENKQTSLKTEGQLLAAEYQEYDQAISSSIKEATPKFGLA